MIYSSLQLSKNEVARCLNISIEGVDALVERGLLKTIENEYGVRITNISFINYIQSIQQD